MRELPEGWAEANLKEVAKLINGDRGKNYPSKNAFVEIGVPFINAGHLVDGKIDIDRMNYITEEHFSILGSGKVQSNDVLYCLRGSLGKIAIIKDIEKGAIASSLVIARSLEICDYRYLYYFLVSPLGEEEISRYDNGSAQPNLSATNVGLYKIPLSPLNEQKRIADRLDLLLTRIDKTKAHLDRIPPLLKRFRQSVLAAATSGKLTEDWREESLSLKNGEQLLQSIREERYEMWKDDLIQKGKEWKKLKYKTNQNADTDQMYSIPKSWTWTNLGELTWSVKDGPHYTPQYSGSGIPFISGGNITPDGIDFENARFISPELHQELSERCCPQLGDILYTKGGTTGIARVNTYEIDFNVWVHVAVLKRVKSVESFYLQHALNSPHCYAQSQKFTHGVGNQDLGLTRMINITVPLPPIEEQQEIVRRVEALFAKADRIEAQYQKARQEVDRLTPALLAKAFRGELVPQDPNDEPASVLLERVKEVRSATTKPAKAKRQKKS